MMIQKQSPQGIDWYVQALQKRIHDHVVAKWPNTVTYKSYPRCYRNKRDKGYVAELYSANNNYTDVYWDDKVDAISFFGTDSKIGISTANMTGVHLVFFVNLSKLKPSRTDRADQEVRADVLEAIGRYSFGFRVDSVEMYLENVLKEYPGSYENNSLKVVDMHPIHCFRINFTLMFDPNKNC